MTRGKCPLCHYEKNAINNCAIWIFHDPFENAKWGGYE